MDEEDYCYCHYHDDTYEYFDCLDYMECEECPYYYADEDYVRRAINMTIDEAIAHAREVAEEQRELFRLCPYPSQECNGADICKCLKNKHDGCIKCAEEHKQLAEWLEELKAIKDGSIPIIHGKAELELHDKEIYNKALEKQIPKKPIKDKYVPELDFCPECGTEVTNCNYCPLCGQKIDCSK